MNRGSGRRSVFRTDDDRRCFVSLLANLDERFAVEVHAYCLMGNHFHVLTRSREGRLSEAMQWVGSCFTRAANWARRVDGPIFRGRFHSVDADVPEHRSVLGAYVHANPLELGWSAPLARYPWSSLPVYGGAWDQPWLHQEVLISIAGSREGVVAAAERRRSEAERTGPTTIPAGSNEIDMGVVTRTVTVMSGVTGEVPSRSMQRSIALAIAVDDIGIDRDGAAAHLGLDSGAFRVALSRGRSAATDRFSAVADATRTALQLVSDTSGNAWVGRVSER